ncbi:MgtC/SapB family protein [Natronoglycomyces albus]|uniref:MgtC/SapB family protein n=1 Tax=Natronoglycomyces albus TaxID=2811108 RepID=A0A895XJJ2_9ACTN|nr:MgtC/SapB family protein [Natronoglycomyces albus]QSB05931.1 MgtC/SapB family protein [Natronoglycomyces albus]
MLETWEFLIRIVLAVILGALIGFERQWRARMAGLRTNALVATGAALFVLFSANAMDEVSSTRVAAQVVSGIGFLGAGVILRDGINIRGINTAATIWCAAAIGVLAGSGNYVGAAAGAFTVVLVNILLRPIARRIERLPESSHSEVESTYFVKAVCDKSETAHVRSLLIQSLHRNGVAIRSMNMAENPQGDATVTTTVATPENINEPLEHTVRQLSLESQVRAVEWRKVDENSSPAGLFTRS